MTGIAFLGFWSALLLLNLPILSVIVRFFSFPTIQDFIQANLFHLAPQENARANRTIEMLLSWMTFAFLLAIEIFALSKLFPEMF